MWIILVCCLEWIVFIIFAHSDTLIPAVSPSSHVRRSLKGGGASTPRLGNVCRTKRTHLLYRPQLEDHLVGKYVAKVCFRITFLEFIHVWILFTHDLLIIFQLPSHLALSSLFLIDWFFCLNFRPFTSLLRFFLQIIFCLIHSSLQSLH